MRIKRRTHRFLDRGEPSSTTAKDLGSATKRGQSAQTDSGDGKFKAQAGFSNTNINQLPIEIDIDPLLKDILFSEDLEQKRLIMRIYKDIYYNDPIGGSCVDLTAMMTFSDFNLGGISDKRVSRAFHEVLERLNCRTLLPEASIDHQVTGAFVASMPYSESRNTFVDMITHQFENCKIDPLPFYSQDPIITVAMPESYKQIMGLDTPRMQKIREYLGEDVSNQLRSDALELDPLSTIYIPRKSFTNTTGVSYYRRILPLWLLEKNLFRGTLVESARRQRGILHLTLGDGDQWEPTITEMQAAMELFQNADADPLGAVIATRMGIDTQELRCLDGSTLLSTDIGITQIRNLVDHKRNGNPVSVKVDLKVKGINGEFVDVDEWHYQGNREAYRVTVTSGASIVSSCNHKHLVLTDTGELKRLPLSDITTNHYLCSELNGQCIDAPLPLELESDVTIRSDNCHITTPVYMTDDLAYLIGLIVSDGYVSGSGIHFSNTDMNLINAFKRCVKNVFNVDVEQNLIAVAGERGLTKDYYGIGVNSRRLRDYIQQLGVMTTPQARKLSDNSPCLKYGVPNAILESNRKHRLSFLAGFIDGDGSVVLDKSSKSNSVEIKLFSHSKRMLRTMQTLLADMGYRSVRSKHRITLQSSVAVRLYNELKDLIQSERKAPFDFCDELEVRKYGIPSCAFMPILNSRLIRRAHGGGNWFLDDDGNAIHVEGPFKYLFRHYDKAGSYLLYSAFDKGAYTAELKLIESVSKKLHTHLMRLFELRLMFEQVTSIESVGKRHLYDLSIKGNDSGNAPLFVANGFVTSNSGGDFWKVTDLWDQTAQAKLRALMVSEAFLSGEACMVGSTLIPTEERGLVRIDELCSPEQKDRKMHDIDITVSGRYSKLKAEKWLYNGRRKTMRVTTDLGNVLTCTPNHPLLVLDDDGLGTSWVRTDRVKIGDYLCVPVRRIVRTTPLELNLSEHMEYPSKGHNGKQLTRPEYMTPELAYFIGMFIAEGNWSNGDTRLNISNTDTALLSRCVESVSKVFGLDVDIHKSKRFVKGAKYCVNGNEGTLNKDVYSIRIHSKQLVKWFEELGVYPTRGEKSMSHYKDVPWSILQADVKSQCAFLAAYLEGDGHIHHSGRIQWISVSRKVLSKIQLMLQSMGYIAARSGRKVSLGYLDSENLMDELMPYMDSKFILYYKERKARNSYYLPDLTVRSLMKERKVRDTRYGSYFLNDDGEEILIQGYKKRNDRNFLYDCVDSGKYDVALAALAEVSSDTHEKLSHMLSLRYRYVKVTSIDEGKVRDVYDISMGDQEPAFVANGCIVHNTYSTGDTGLTVFIEYMRSYRDMMTNRMFYNKIFPLISALNGFTLNDRGKLTVRGNMLDKFDVMRNHEVLQDGSRLLIPSVHWTKSLKPEGDATYMDMLQQLTDKGVPVPIRAMAAAGGFNLESLLASQEDDFELIKRVGTYQKKIEELKKEYMPEGSGDESAMAAVASDLMRREIQRATGTRSDVLSYNNGKMVGLADRTYPEEMMEVPGEMKGKKRWLYNQRRANERANRKIAEQLEEVTRRQRSHLTHETVSPRKLSV